MPAEPARLRPVNPAARLTPDTRFLAAALAASLALSLWSIWSFPRVNTDAILYLIAAEAWLRDGLQASMALYNWPFFQIAFAVIHKLTGLPLLWAARLLMTGCFLALTAGFCLVIRELGGDRKTLWFALLIILCLPELNEHRANLVRDPGMLAFLLLALWQQLRLANTGHWRHALLWALNIGIAALFRMEALAIALLAPAAMMLLTGKARRERLILAAKLAALPAAIGAVALTVSALLPGVFLSSKLSNDVAVFLHKLNRIGSDFTALADTLASQVLGEFSQDDGTLALVAVFLTVTLAGIARAISLPYLLALAVGWWRRTPGAINPGSRVAGLYGLVIFGYLLAFVLTEHFTSTRYGLPLAALLLLPLPFYLRQWWNNAPRQHLVRGLVVLLLTANGADSLISSDWKKSYISDAAHWTAEADGIASGSLIANEPYIAYFSGKSTTEQVMRAINPSRQALTETIDTHWLPAHVYAHRVRQGEAEEQLKADVQRGNGEILQLFRGQDKRSIYVFRVQEPIARSPLLLERPS